MSFRASLQAMRRLPAIRRSYSFFSSKSGAGRYLSATKAPKVPANASSSTTSSSSPAQTQQVESSEERETTAAPTSQLTSTSPATAQSAPELRQDEQTLSANAQMLKRPPHGEDLSLNDVLLHSLFAQHRPLLLLPVASSVWSAAPLPPSPAESSVLPNVQLDGPHIAEDPPEASPQSDADAARLLSRTLVINRIGAWAEWHRVLAELGDDTAVQLDSTRRKKRKKMKKHKLLKRRRLLRKNNKMGSGK